MMGADDGDDNYGIVHWRNRTHLITLVRFGYKANSLVGGAFALSTQRRPVLSLRYVLTLSARGLLLTLIVSA
jgi:hypothetical protein